MSEIRNVVILGHMTSGKTSLVEALYHMSLGTKKGSVERKNTVSDYLPLEQKHESSIKSAIIPLTYNDCRFNLIDMPGNDDFVTEVISAVNVVKGAVLVIDASKGVEVGTIKHYNMLKKRGIPCIIFINKMDKDNINFNKLLDDIREKLGKNAIPFSYPMGHNDQFDGFVNCVLLKARKFNGVTCEDAEIYPDKRAKVFELHNMMVEAVAETSEELLEKFFSGEQLTTDEIRNGLRIGVLNGELTPILVGSALKGIGLHTLLDMLLDYLPSPKDLKPLVGMDDKGELVERITLDSEPFSAFVFKTIYDIYSGLTSIFKVNSGILRAGDEVFIPELNKSVTLTQIYSICGGKLSNVNEIHAGDIGAIVKCDGLTNSMTICSPKSVINYPKIEYPKSVYFKALEPKSKSDEEKISQVLQRLMLEDPSISVRRNKETSELLIGVLGQGHLNYVLENMKDSYKLDVLTRDYKVVYRETIKAKANGIGRYIKQSGGSGFYGVVEMSFEPAEENIFTEEVFGGAIPKNYFPAVEKGFFEACEKGLLKGYPVIGVKATLLDGKYHAVDSNELAFKMAAILAFKEAYMNCKPVLLEPIMRITVTVGSDDVGNVLSDLNQKRAKVIDMSINSTGNQKIVALVPEAEILEYVNELKSMTQGFGYFSLEFEKYEEVPEYIKEKLLK